MIDPVRLGQLTRAIARLAARPASYDGYCYRVNKPRYGNRRDAFSGEGSRYASGRFNAQRAFLIVYTSCSFEGASWEFTHTARSSGVDLASLLPISTLSGRAQFSQVLDLTNRAARRALGVTLADLRSQDWVNSQDEALTQTIGRLAFDAGFEAILAPSAAGSPNLNILPANILPGSVLEIINENELPPPI